MTRKDIKWDWGAKEQEAFNAIKTEITKDPVLVIQILINPTSWKPTHQE
jgi:hypothetical protein